MKDRQEKAFLKLMDEAERVLLILQQDGLPIGKYPHLARAIEEAKKSMLPHSPTGTRPGPKRGAQTNGQQRPTNRPTEISWQDAARKNTKPKLRRWG